MRTDGALVIGKSTVDFPQKDGAQLGKDILRESAFSPRGQPLKISRGPSGQQGDFTLARLRAGELSSADLSSCIDLMRKDIMRVLAGRGLSRDDCECLAQETLAKTFAALPKCTATNWAVFKGWYKKIAIREMLDEMKRRDRKHLTYEGLAEQSREENIENTASYSSSLLTSEYEDPQVQLLRRKIDPALIKAVASLEPQSHEVFMLHLSGCSYAEIAEELKIPMGTVKSRLSRAKSYLKERLRGLEGHWRDCCDDFPLSHGGASLRARKVQDAR